MSDEHSPFDENRPDNARQLSLWQRLDRALYIGFSVLDYRISLYALGTALCGLGAGAFFVRTLEFRRVRLETIDLVSLGLMATGFILANVSHGSLMRAEIKRTDDDSEQQPPQDSAPRP